MELLTFCIITVAFVFIFTLEVIAPASKNLCDRRWFILASLISLLQSVFTVATGVIFDKTLRQISIFNFGDLNLFYQALLAFSLSSFVGYWWHRAMHKFDFLWRTFHQLHHSPRRIESVTAFYLHPFDGLGASFLNVLCCYLILGLTPEGAALNIILGALYNVYIHADLKTPRWFGFILQRPEMHRVHHKHMHHDQNYGISLWDFMFGTYENPTEYVEEVGFDEARANRIYDMLRTKDVYRTKASKDLSNKSQTKTATLK